MDKKSTVKIWEDLHKQKYFENHPLYNLDDYDIPHCTKINNILDKSVMDFGCGYGRESYFLSIFANRVYCVDVCNEILNKTKENLCSCNNIKYLLEKDLDKIEDNSLDYIYALHVFQHITKEQGKQYINIFRKKLKKDAYIMVQFYLGKDNLIEDQKEPRIQYTKEEIMELFKLFNIQEFWTLNKFKKDKSLQYEHYYIKALKNGKD